MKVAIPTTRTVLDLVRETHRETFARWDGWDYRITSPLSLDDLAFVTVTLINESRDQINICFDLEEVIS